MNSPSGIKYGAHNSFALGECAHTVRESKRRTRGMKSWRSARSSALISRMLRPVKFH